MSFVRRLAGHAQGLGDLLPRPSLVNRTLHGFAFHAVGEPSKTDDRRDREAQLLGMGAA